MQNSNIPKYLDSVDITHVLERCTLQSVCGLKLYIKIVNFLQVCAEAIQQQQFFHAFLHSAVSQHGVTEQ